MSCDPLSIATGGIFTCGLENCNPCTIASNGLFTYGIGSQELGDESGGIRPEKGYEEKIKESVDEFIERNTEQRIVERGGTKIAVTSPTFITPKESAVEPTALQIKSIPNRLDQELAREIRQMMIMEQSRLILEEVFEQQEFDENVIAVLLMSEA